MIHRQIGIVAAIAGWFVEAAETVEVSDAEDVGEGSGGTIVMVVGGGITVEGLTREEYDNLIIIVIFGIGGRVSGHPMSVSVGVR